jgi:hypothetical protein
MTREEDREASEDSGNRKEAGPANHKTPRTANRTAARPVKRVVLEDKFAYRLAVGAVGLALVTFLIGAAIIAAGGNPVPTQFWSTGSGLAGALLGILAPNPSKTDPADASRNGFITLLSDLWNNRAVLLLLALFIVSAVLAAVNKSPELQTVAAAAGGALIGLLAPPPGGQQDA